MAAHRHGAGRISAAIFMAPLAASLLLLALVTCLPIPRDLGTVTFFLGLAPGISIASSWALLSHSGARAWIGSATVAALGTLALVLS